MNGRCTNRPSECSKAASGELIPMASPDTRCPECQGRLIQVKTTGGPGRARWIALGATGLAVAALAVIALQLTQSSGSGGSAPTEKRAYKSPDPVLTPPASEPTVILRLKGSNTIGSELGPRLAQAWLEQIGDTDVRIVREPGKEDDATVVGKRNGGEEAITVAAHGSATAFAGLKDGTTDVGLASRRVKSDEREALMSSCDMTSSACEHVLALDGVAVIVNHANRIDSLTVDQLRSVFTGALNDWSQLGLSPGPIDIYARDNKSGTYDTFVALVLSGQKLRADVRRFEDSAELASAVDGDVNGIGFVGLPYVGPTKAIAVAAAGTQPLRPNRLTVATEDYVLSRRLYLYGPQPSAPPAARRFIEFALSPQGQKIVEETGFVSLTIHAEPAKVPLGAPPEYRALVDGSQRLQFDFRFAFNSADLDNRALRDTQRLADFMQASQVTPERLLLIGFADSRGTQSTNKALSERRALAVGKILERDGINAGKIIGLGDLLPVADNATDEGREKNRRVEVYVRP